MGLLDATKDKLTAAGIAVHVYDGVEPNPTYTQVHAGLKLAKANNCDAVLAFGGGSPIDVAKIISVGATNERSPEELGGIFKVKEAGLPLYAVPTTAGTGSEVSLGAVISDPISHEKITTADTKIVPVAAALDPQLMLGLPPHITAATGMDALTHAIEAYLSAKATVGSDAYALASAKLIFENLREAYTNGTNIDAREGMVVASCYAAYAFNSVGLGYVHGVAHQLSAYYDTPHGIANTVTLPHVLDFLQAACEAKLASLALATGQANSAESKAVQAQKFIAAVRQLATDLGIPPTLDALKVADIPGIAKGALKESHYGFAVPRYMNQKQCEALITKMVN